MEEVDVKVCGDIFCKGIGYECENDIRIMFVRWFEGCWVVIMKDNMIV